MIVMPAANGNTLLGYLAGRFPGKVGTMVSPSTGWMKPHHFLPWSLDNGRYADTVSGRDWDEKGFLDLLEKSQASPYPPMWVVAPDVLYSRDETLRDFEKWFPRLDQMGFRVAMACQDGMTPMDVPEGVVAFIGCSEELRRKVSDFIDYGHEVHFGRVNSLAMLKHLHRIGVHSCDSSGWFRQGGDESIKGRTKDLSEWRVAPILQYLEWSVSPVYEPMLFDLYDQE